MSEKIKLQAYNRFFKKELPICYIDDHVVIYDDLLPSFAKLLKSNIKDHKQNGILIVGHTGSGKSTIAVKLCALLDKDWSLDNDYIYGMSDLKRKVRNPGSCPVSLLDEGSVSLNSYNSQKSDDKKMTILMDSWRVLGKTIVICMPNGNDLNKRVSRNHIDYMIVCPAKSPRPGKPARGHYTIYKHEYRDWGKDWWKPIGTSTFTKLDKATQAKYDKIKLEHLEKLLFDFTNDDEE
jgi:hypothetical protein